MALFDSIDNSQHTAVKPVFQQFHDAITAVFPCICDLDDDDGEEGVWSDGPLINNFKCEIPVIGLSFSHLEEAMPVVVETARDLGISILDWQTGEVYNA